MTVGDCQWILALRFSLFRGHCDDLISDWSEELITSRHQATLSAELCCL
jgi:hypothetical protein